MNNKLNIFAILFLLSFGSGSFSYGQPSRSSWSLKSSFLYMNMKMDDYNNFVMNENERVGKEFLKTLNSAFGGTIELRRHLFRRFYAGIETGILSVGTQSSGNVQVHGGLVNSEYRQKLSLTSMPANLNLYYSLIKRENLNIFSGFSPGIWFSKIKYLQSSDYTDGEGQGFIYEKDVLKSQNFSYCFQLGSEYRVLRKVGIDLKISYRSANFKGFRGDSNMRWIYVNKAHDISRFEKGSGKVKLTYDPAYKLFSTQSENSTGVNEAHMNMGNWGFGMGLIWFF